jgi:hypothetical protein
MWRQNRIGRARSPSSMAGRPTRSRTPQTRRCPTRPTTTASRINRTKLPTWRRWLDCLGLSIALPGVSQSHPSADARLAREFSHIAVGTEETGVELPAEACLQRLAQRLPYLDGGRMFAVTARRIGHAPSRRQLSPLLSASLRNLHDEGVIELRLRGDAGDVVHLSPESTHQVQTFHGVMILGGAQ